jgi:hypothetical protein
LPEFLEAAGRLAVEAAERGDLTEARRLLEEALRAIPFAPALRAVT